MQLPLDKKIAKTFWTFGLVGFIIGVACVIIEAVGLGLVSVDLKALYSYVFVAPGICLGTLFMATGGVGISLKHCQVKCLVLSFTILSAVSAFMSFLLIALSIYYAEKLFRSNREICNSSSNNTATTPVICKTIYPAAIMDVVLVVLGSLEAIVTIASCIYCCAVGACCVSCQDEMCCYKSTAVKTGVGEVQPATYYKQHAVLQPTFVPESQPAHPQYQTPYQAIEQVELRRQHHLQSRYLFGQNYT